MPATTKDPLFSAGDIKFVLTFAAGMGAFWLSGHLPAYLPHQLVPGNRTGAYILGLALALVIYGLAMAVWSWLILGRQRRLKAALVAGGIVAILAMITSLVLSNTGLGSPKNQAQLAVLAFSLYLVYGIYFVIGWTVAGRLARK